MISAEGFEILKGHVEADESFVGGVRRRRPDGSGPGYGKTIVLGLKERGGRMTTHIVPNVKTDTLRRIVLRNVEKGSVVSTDELKSYNLLTRDGYEHGSVNHSAKEYARGPHHTNHVESFWRLFKDSIRSTHIHVSPKTWIDILVSSPSGRTIARCRTQCSTC
jgi:transposase-like protein